MYEAMQLIQEGSRTYSFKIRKGFFKTKEAAIEYAKKKKAPNGIPYVQLEGRCVWSPLSERLGLQ